ncbi:hypothetical protein G7Y89_g8086 [Cudoniella acicularis]|uniref:Uncharacterized protein n=1 Tax=Cudoniella acicularis TaxID=354080 RepID=A0A8H4RIT5_9HELO|nr:hypothetical protein G7Y89_g8086 [Cudoniella acicularis]
MSPPLPPTPSNRQNGGSVNFRERQNAQFASPKKCAMAQNKGPMVAILAPTKDDFASTEVIAIEICELVASYNWLESENPTILVPVETFRPGGFQSQNYGYWILQAMTTYGDDYKESSSHYRIVTYKLGDMEYLVRFEADALLDDNADPKSGNVEERKINMEDGHTIAQQTAEPPTPSRVQVIDRGEAVTQSQILEIKSCIPGEKEYMSKNISQFWISRTQRILLASHQNGLIETEPTKYNIGEQFKDWEVKMPKI